MKPALPAAGSICNAAAAGVQFVFSGASRLNVEAGTVELCGPLAVGSTPSIAVFGSTTGEGAATLSPTGAGTTVKFANVNPGAFTFGDGMATAVLGRKETASAVLNGFDQVAIPAGSTVKTATLRVAHEDDGDFGSGSVRLTKADGTSCTLTTSKKKNLATESFDVKTCLSTAASFAGLSAEYAVSTPDANKAAMNAGLDGVAIDVSWVQPGLAPQSGCITNPGFPKTGSDATRCALIKTSGAQTQVAIRGMVYAPRAPIDLAATEASTQMFSGGVVARTLRANVTPAATFGGQVISVPGGAVVPPQPRTVDLVATIDGVVKLRATVQFTDQPAPGTGVTVKRWTVVR